MCRKAQVTLNEFEKTDERIRAVHPAKARRATYNNAGGACAQNLTNFSAGEVCSRLQSSHAAGQASRIILSSLELRNCNALHFLKSPWTKFRLWSQHIGCRTLVSNLH